MPRRSLQLPPIPDETASVAGLVYEGGNGFLALGDRYRALFGGLDLDSISAAESAEPAAALALMTIFQFIEGLTDSEAATALRTRVDWDYALHLPLDHELFDPRTLPDFRARVVASPDGRRTFDELLERVRAITPRWPWPNEPLAAEEVVRSVEVVNTLPMAIKALWLAVEALSMEAPGWLWERPWLQSRYAHSHGWLRLPADPRERARLAKTIEHDGLRLLTDAARDDAPPEVSSLEEIMVVWHVWRWQFDVTAPLAAPGGCVEVAARARAAG